MDPAEQLRQALEDAEENYERAMAMGLPGLILMRWALLEELQRLAAQEREE